MNIANYPPTIEEINFELLEPFLNKKLRVSYRLENGEIETCKGTLTFHSKFSDIGEHDPDGVYLLEWDDGKGYWDEAILNYSEPFDKEDPESNSLIVTDGCSAYGGSKILIEFL